MPLLLEQAKELSWSLYAGENILHGLHPGLVRREGVCIILGRASGVNPFCGLCSGLLWVLIVSGDMGLWAEGSITGTGSLLDEEGKEQREKGQNWMPLGVLKSIKHWGAGSTQFLVTDTCDPLYIRRPRGREHLFKPDFRSLQINLLKMKQFCAAHRGCL